VSAVFWFSQPFCDRFHACAWSLSQFRFAVATTEDKKEKKSWNEAKTVVPLRCDSDLSVSRQSGKRRKPKG